MQLSFLLSELNYVPTDLSTEAVLTFEDGTITKMHLELKGDVPGITNEEFQNIALKAKQICPVSKVLNAEITLTATLA
ncbi:Peroxiredoxin OsmC [compost metagenome]